MYSIGTKLGINEFFYMHVGTYWGNGLVFHHHWRNGPEIISLETFSNGKQITVLEQGVANIIAYRDRVQRVLASRNPYHIIKNNCEHAASYVRKGIASSPQLAFYGVLALTVGGYFLLRKAKS